MCECVCVYVCVCVWVVCVYVVCVYVCVWCVCVCVYVCVINLQQGSSTCIKYCSFDELQYIHVANPLGKLCLVNFVHMDVCGDPISQIWSQNLIDSCNMGTRDLPDMYAQSPRAAGPRAEGIHIRQITSAHVTTIM